MSLTSNGIYYRLEQEGSATSLFIYPNSKVSLDALADCISELREIFGSTVPIKVDASKGQEIAFRHLLENMGYRECHPGGTEKPYILINMDLLTADSKVIRQHILFLRQLSEQLNIVWKNMNDIHVETADQIHA